MNATSPYRGLDRARPAVTMSVVIPTYNRTRFLEEGVESLLKQTLPAGEIVIVDDGSDDGFRPQLARIAGRHETIALHALPSHQGVARARNVGLERAQGDYIFFLDDDDMVPPTLFEAGASELDADQSLSGVIFPTRRCRSTASTPRRATRRSPTTGSREAAAAQAVRCFSSRVPSRGVDAKERHRHPPV